MSQSAPATVLLKGSPPVKEALAGGTITPGHLITRGSGNTMTVAGAASEGLPLFAVENDTVGKGITTDYASGDLVQYVVGQPGDEINALVPAAAAAIVIGDLLQAGAGGTVIKRTTTNKVFAIARTAVDNSAGGLAVRLRIELM
jgi:hypothetical protein